jgi:hypothetical protein
MTSAAASHKPTAERSFFDLMAGRTGSKYRLLITTGGVVFSLFLIIMTWWFWEEVVHAPWRPRFDLIGYLTAIGLMTCAGFNLIGFLLFGARQKLGTEVVKFCMPIIGILLIPLIINIAVFLFRSSDFYGFSNLWQSFIDFNRITIGGVGFSVTGVLTLLVILLGVIGALKKAK